MRSSATALCERVKTTVCIGSFATKAIIFAGGRRDAKKGIGADVAPNNRKSRTTLHWRLWARISLAAQMHIKSGPFMSDWAPLVVPSARLFRWNL